MLKDFAWNAFEYTGNIDSYIFYKEIEQRNNAREQSKMAEAEAATSSLKT